MPAGTPHAIGAGILMVELQEPTDFSVLLEWAGFELSEDDGHLNLGWDERAAAADLRAARAWPGCARAGGPRRAAFSPRAADPYFRAERIRPSGGEAECEPSFAVLVGLEGEALRTERGDELACMRA